MEITTKVTHSRLLYADFILDDNAEKEIIDKIKRFGFGEQNQGNNLPLKFSTEKIDDFIKQLQSVCKSDSELLKYIKNIVFWIYREGILPLKVAIIEVVLNADRLQNLEKAHLESNIWNLSLFLGDCFCESPIPAADLSKDFRILKFSSKAIPNVTLRNFVAEFVIEADRKFFDNFNKELDSLEREIFLNDLKEQQIIEYRDNHKIPASEVREFISKATDPSRQKINDTMKNIISLEPVSFFKCKFPYDQSIVRGYTNEMFIIGKIVQDSLENSAPLYLTLLSMVDSQIPSANLESMPVLQFPGGPPLLDFSFGAGQIITLQLLNSWNRHVEMSITEITTKQKLDQMKTRPDTDETLEELRNLLSHTGIDEKISVNYRRKLQDLANPSKKTFLYEFSMPQDQFTPYSINPEKYGLEKSGHIISDFASLILKSLDLNEKHLLYATDLRRSKIGVLKIEEDRKFSRWMFYLTVVIAVATIVNVVLFFVRIT